MYRFSKQSVLRKNKQFRLVYRYGKSWANRLAVLYVLPQSKQNLSERRVGFVTGKKIGGAVARNRAKRLLREAYRLLQPQLQHGYDMVIVGRSSLTQANCQNVQKALLDLFHRSQVIKKENK